MSTGKFFMALVIAVMLGMTIGILDMLNVSAAAHGGILVVPHWVVKVGGVLFMLAMMTLIPALRLVRESEGVR